MASPFFAKCQDWSEFAPLLGGSRMLLFKAVLVAPFNSITHCLYFEITQI